MDGYPGVPAGIEPKVAEHARAASDFLLYRSLLSDYTLRGYDAADPVLAGMKKYGDDLQTYLTTSIQTTPELPTLPTIAPNSAIESFAQIDAASWAGKAFVVHSYKNGFLPKKLADYEIPLRYTRDNVRNGVTFSPITVNHQVLAYATEKAQDMQLWAV